MLKSLWTEIEHIRVQTSTNVFSYDTYLPTNLLLEDISPIFFYLCLVSFISPLTEIEISLRYVLLYKLPQTSATFSKQIAHFQIVRLHHLLCQEDACCKYFLLYIMHHLLCKIFSTRYIIYNKRSLKIRTEKILVYTCV